MEVEKTPDTAAAHALAPAAAGPVPNPVAAAPAVAAPAPVANPVQVAPNPATPIPAVSAPAVAATVAPTPPTGPTRAPVLHANCDPIMQQRRDSEVDPNEEQTHSVLWLKGVHFDCCDSIWTINRILSQAISLSWMMSDVKVLELTIRWLTLKIGFQKCEDASTLKTAGQPV